MKRDITRILVLWFGLGTALNHLWGTGGIEDSSILSLSSIILWNLIIWHSQFTKVDMQSQLVRALSNLSAFVVILFFACFLLLFLIFSLFYLGEELFLHDNYLKRLAAGEVSWEEKTMAQNNMIAFLMFWMVLKSLNFFEWCEVNSLFLWGKGE